MIKILPLKLYDLTLLKSSLFYFLFSISTPCIKLLCTSTFALFFKQIFVVLLGARFGFILEEELKEAASCDDVKAAIAEKISRERIGHEVCLFSCIHMIACRLTK